MVDVPPEVAELVARFERGRHTYLAQTYNETQVRREFIDPLFKSLGWDMDNAAGYAEAYKDVVHEDRIRVAGASKAPDYSFRVGGTRKFFVEAKRPSANLKDDPLPAYQLRRYAWNAKLPLSVLTDFEEFVVYDCRDEPRPSDKASAKRLLYIRCGEYATRWDEIASIFSKQEVLQGSFDEYAVSLKGKRGTAEVDRIFLAEMESWREALARNLILRNELSQRELNFAVQQTIDRIVFLRICEDRGIEAYGELKGALAAPDIYAEIVRQFQRADDLYNSGLFHFKSEANQPEEPDRLTPGLRIDNAVLKLIISRLYYPESPYQFDVLPPDILGQVYEQFLGKTILKTSARRVTVEEKPAVKKAGGIVYTPSLVVNYIVRHSLEALLEGKSVADVEGSGRGKTAHPLRVLDPACGSGSFLIVAYESLLRWFLERYRGESGKWSKGRNPRVRLSPTGEWRLTAGERRRILLDHIYGVDIDVQAVEVTKLSLLLKVLEGETEETVGQQRTLFHQRALPDLASNIRCGNSLIASDFDAYRQTRLDFDEEDGLRINAFDWADEFPGALGGSELGFDVVIGNPPYVVIQGEFRDDEQLAYFRERYTTASFKLDLYHLFMERSIQLTREGGVCSMITPSNFLTNNHLDHLRRYLLDSSEIDHIAVVDKGVFEGRAVDNAIFVVRGGGPTVEPLDIRSIEPSADGWTTTTMARLPIANVRANPSLLFTGSGNPEREEVWQRLGATSVELGQVATVNFGKQLRDRRVFKKDVISIKKPAQAVAPYRPCYTGGDVQHYRASWSGLACLDSEAARRGGCWDRSKQDAKNKLLTKQIGRFPDFALDARGYQCLNTMFMVNPTAEGYSPTFLLGYLNSTLMRAYWIDHFYDRRRTFPKIKGTFLKQLPIVQLSDSAPDRAWHDAVETKAALLITLHERLAHASTSHEQTSARRSIAQAERALDTLVYERLELSAAEVANLADAGA